MTSKPGRERMVVGEVSYPLFQQHLNRYVFANQFVEQRRVLDVACGSGYGTLSHLEQGKASQVIGADISWQACCQAHAYGIEVVMADANRLPFRSHYFEVIISLETIEHLSTPQDFVLECHRLLESEGKFIVSTPNRQMSIFQDNPYHFQEYYPQEFINLLQKFFSNIETYGQMYRSYPVQWLRSVVGKLLGFTKIGKKIITFTQRRFLGVRPAQEVDLSIVDEAYKVVPAKPFGQKLVQPHYIVCVAEKR